MGKYFEEFRDGQSFKSPARTVTETDIVNFAGLTGDFNPVHTDETFASQTDFGERIAHGPMMIGMSFGLLSRLDLLDGTVIALRDIQWSFEAAVRIGDTIHVEAKVLETRASRRAVDRGYVSLELLLTNQDKVLVQSGKAGVIVQRKP